MSHRTEKINKNKKLKRILNTFRSGVTYKMTTSITLTNYLSNLEVNKGKDQYNICIWYYIK